MKHNFKLIEDLNDALSGKASQQRGEMLLRMADLFAFGSGGFTDDQIRVFDDVFVQLVDKIEATVCAALAERLSKIPQSPPSISRVLARSEMIGIARPMLEHSSRLDSRWLAELARTRSQDHLLAISKRSSLDEIVTDVLIERGNKPVVLSTAGNPGAKISDTGFLALLHRSDADEELAIRVGLRRDVPRHHLLKLLAKASYTVRAKLAAANPAMSEIIQHAVSEAATLIQTKTKGASRDFQVAIALVEELQATGRLAESDIAAFAKAGKFEETTAALAAVCNLPIEIVERAMVQERAETVLIITKAIGISWPTVKAILKMRSGNQGISPHQLEQCLGTFSRLKPATARQVIEFQRNRVQPR